MKYRPIIYLICAFSLCNNSFAQSTTPFKEHWDDLHVWYTVNEPHYQNLDYNDCYITGNSLSWLLSSYIRLYKSTNDKAYLIKFINHCIRLQKVRWDERIPSYNAPIWIRAGSDSQNPTLDDLCDGVTNNAEPAYFNSLILMAMAEFVEMVVNEPGHILYNTDLPILNPSTPLIDLNTLYSMNPAFPILGYGDFANWLGKRIEESLFYMFNNYWNDSYGLKSHFTDVNKEGAEMNMQSPFATALLFMGLSNTNFGYGNNRADYLYKSQLIAELYIG